jgi:hypothetical protein
MAIYQVPELSDIDQEVLRKINELRENLRFATSDNLHRWTGLLSRTTTPELFKGRTQLKG